MSNIMIGNADGKARKVNGIFIGDANGKAISIGGSKIPFTMFSYDNLIFNINKNGDGFDSIRVLNDFITDWQSTGTEEEGYHDEYLGSSIVPLITEISVPEHLNNQLNFKGLEKFPNLKNIAIKSNNIQKICGKINDGYNNYILTVHSDSPLYQTILKKSAWYVSGCLLGVLKNTVECNIENGTYLIGDFACNNISTLRNIEFPTTLKRIGQEAFSDNPKLQINISNLNFNNIEYIGPYAFAKTGAYGILNIEQPENTIYIGERAFQNSKITECYIYNKQKCSFNIIYNCQNLVKIYWNSNISNTIYNQIGNTFQAPSLIEVSFGNNVENFPCLDAPNLTTVTIGENIKNIPARCLRYTYCPKLETIYWNAKQIETVWDIGSGFNTQSHMFGSKPSVKNIIFGPTVRIIPDYCFYGCSSINNIQLAEGVEIIGYQAFHYNQIQYITIPNSVKVIKQEALYGCPLTEIYIGTGLETVEDYAFYNCTQLKNVYYKGTQEQWANINFGIKNESLLNATIHYNSNF